MHSHFERSLSSSRIVRSARQMSLAIMLVVTLGACTSQAARDAELASQAAAQAALEQEAARVEQERERQIAAELQRQRDAEAAERTRLQAERDREAEAARMRAEIEREQREASERREQVRLAAIAAAAAEQQAKQDRIEELQTQIAALQEDVRNNTTATAILIEAVQAAEELLEALTAEQAKYENTDAEGNTLQPLEKDLIAELQARKDDLVRRAVSGQ